MSKASALPRRELLSISTAARRANATTKCIYARMATGRLSKERIDRHVFAFADEIEELRRELESRRLAKSARRSA